MDERKLPATIHNSDEEEEEDNDDNNKDDNDSPIESLIAHIMIWMSLPEK